MINGNYRCRLVGAPAAIAHQKNRFKNIKSAMGEASRKQVMRELQKRFTEEQIREIEQLLAKAAKLMGEDPPNFLPPP